MKGNVRFDEKTSEVVVTGDYATMMRNIAKGTGKKPEEVLSLMLRAGMRADLFKQKIYQHLSAKEVRRVERLLR